MALNDICALTVEQLSIRIRRKDLSPVEATAGLSAEGLPIGVHVMAAHFDEVHALRVANAIIQSAPELRQLRSPLAA